jgi:hypothetical protein
MVEQQLMVLSQQVVADAAAVALPLMALEAVVE